MFDTLSKQLSATVRSLTGRGQLSEDNIKAAVRQVRLALLEADVALPVVKNFIENVKQQAVGTTLNRAIDPGDAFIKIVHRQLVATLGAETADLNLKAAPPVVILLAGLQGAGKTTTAAKLARWLEQKNKKRVGLVSVDVQRPAAILQLARLADDLSLPHYQNDNELKALKRTQSALKWARSQNLDVLIVDTAGRQHVDETLMQEVQKISEIVQATETLFVVDSMMGQDAVNAAKAFNDALSLTGVVLIKADGDARGGAALSVRQVTGCPIKFVGTGEKTDAIEVFHPDRMASRILGKGDVQSLVEEVSEQIDVGKAEKLGKKLRKGRFDLDDLKSQLEGMQNMGGMQKMLEKIPGMGNMMAAAREQMDDNVVRRQIGIVNAMTPDERRFPDKINGSRKRRIAKGSGLEIQDVNRLLKQFKQMQKMMKKMKGKGGMKNLMNQLPPGIRS
ncbi:MAG: signal recognition particle protein [Gammaproteobacteria bacterium]|nr:signal recognition particle protein [Gammaproteobacteria bacterium]